MALDNISFASGITACLIVTTAFLICLYLLYMVWKQRKGQTIGLTVMVFSMGAPWIGASVNFLLYMLTETTMDERAYMMLASFWIWAAPSAAYVTASFLKPEWKKGLTLFFLATTLVFFGIIYILMPLNIVPIETIFTGSPTANSPLPDANFLGITKLYLVMCIGTILVCGSLFLFTAYRSEIPLAKARGYLIGSGSIMFALTGFIDGGIELTAIEQIVIVRILLTIALILVFLGITVPKFIFGRWGIERPS